MVGETLTACAQGSTERDHEHSEPCVRGHRSSKCEHYDRLMMKVPKAGRPLAKCPHPKGSCSCQRIYAIMVRIPRGMKVLVIEIVGALDAHFSRRIQLCV
jgi:hypothetical protein